MLSYDLLQFIRQEKNLSMEFVKQAKACRKTIYLYGGGIHKLYVVRFLQKHGVKVNAILDSFRQGSYEGIPILLYDDFLRSNFDPESWFFISAPTKEREIRKVLEEHFPEEHIFCSETAPYVDWLTDVEKYRAYLMEHWNELSCMYDALADERSKETFVNLIKGRISGRTDYFRAVYAPEKYYPQDIIRLSKGEVWVEAGSFRGETLIDFLKLCPDYQAAYCFEPDEDNLRALNETVAQVQKDGKIKVIPEGAYDSQTKLTLSERNQGSSLSHMVEEPGANGSGIETVTIDETVDEPITYLKVSTCCPELRILRGGEQQIAKNHPRIAVCVSYCGEDLLDLWSYLRKLVPEYRFYLRHHLKDAGFETFLYAV